jgi:RNA polymerase sigma-70 factor (sigma-E family)
MRADGLPADLASFCEEQHPRLVGALSLYCGDPDVGEELAQDAIAYAIRDWKKVRAKDSPAAWLYRVALNLAHSYFRRKRAERRATERLRSLSARGEPGDDQATAHSVRAAVAALPRRQRQALVLRYFLDLSVVQVAHLMDCSEGTVKALTHHAIANLRHGGCVDLLREASGAV